MDGGAFVAALDAAGVSHRDDTVEMYPGDQPPGEPVVHSTDVRLAFTCGEWEGNADFDDANNRVLNFSLRSPEISEQTVDELLAAYRAAYGPPSRVKPDDLGEVHVTDEIWQNDAIVLTVASVEVKGKRRVIVGFQPVP